MAASGLLDPDGSSPEKRTGLTVSKLHSLHPATDSGDDLVTLQAEGLLGDVFASQLPVKRSLDGYQTAISKTLSDLTNLGEVMAAVTLPLTAITEKLRFAPGIPALRNVAASMSISLSAHLELLQMAPNINLIDFASVHPVAFPIVNLPSSRVIGPAVPNRYDRTRPSPSMITGVSITDRPTLRIVREQVSATVHETRIYATSDVPPDLLAVTVSDTLCRGDRLGTRGSMDDVPCDFWHIDGCEGLALFPAENPHYCLTCWIFRREDVRELEKARRRGRMQEYTSRLAAHRGLDNESSNERTGLPTAPSRLTTYRRWRLTWLAVRDAWTSAKYPESDKATKGTFKRLAESLKRKNADLFCTPETLRKIIRAGQAGLLEHDLG